MKHLKVCINCLGRRNLLKNTIFVQTAGKNSIKNYTCTTDRPSNSIFERQTWLPLPHKYSYRRLSSPASSLKEELNISILNGGRNLSMTSNEGLDMRFDSIWLLHNCHCHRCKQDHSGQRLMEVAELNVDTVIKEAEVKGDHLVIKWSNHEGQIPLKILIENNYASLEQSERFSWTDRPVGLPTMTYDDMTNSNEGLLKWLKDINTYGASLLTGVPLEEKSVCKVAEKIAPVMRTIYDTHFVVKSVPNPINIAYSDVPLDYHIDLNYYESPPGLILLHCVQFDSSVVGGESLLLDLCYIAECFRHDHPDDFHILTKVPATFQKIHFDRENPVYMRYQRPHIVLNHREEIVGVNWSPPFEGPLYVKQEDVVPYYKAYQKFAKAIKNSPNKIEFSMKPGDLTAVNNRRLLHARKGFNLHGGTRCLEGCYVNIDDYKCKLHVLATQLGDRDPVLPVGNQDWSTL